MNKFWLLFGTFTISLLVLVFMPVTAAPSEPISSNLIENDEAQIFRDIAASLERTKNLLAQYPEEDSYAAKEICYQNDLGCVSMNGPMKQTMVLPNTLDKIGTAFYAYTNSDSPQVRIDPAKQETFSVVDPNKRLVFIIHGFGNSHTTVELQSIKNNLLSYTNHEIGAVIMVDWENGAAQPNYFRAAANTEVVGRQVAQLINELQKSGRVTPRNVYLIGFSLGAQVSGFAGKWSQSQYNFKLGRITGLDAAAPFFENHPGAYLTKDDAEFVDAIHSSAGKNIIHGEIGFIEPYAHVDFYPNSGQRQPSCQNLLHITCNHYGSVLFYDASLSADKTCQFNAYACDNWDIFAGGKTCTKSDTKLGYWADKSYATGIRYLSTTDKYPFCNTKK